MEEASAHQDRGGSGPNILIDINMYINIKSKNTNIYIYIYKKEIYIKNICNEHQKIYICIKDAHRKTAPDACPETSVRVCFWGVNSRSTFQDFESIFCFLIFRKTYCNSEYLIRIRCIELYMVTWFSRKINRPFSNKI